MTERKERIVRLIQWSNEQSDAHASTIPLNELDRVLQDFSLEEVVTPGAVVAGNMWKLVRFLDDLDRIQEEVLDVTSKTWFEGHRRTSE